MRRGLFMQLARALKKLVRAEAKISSPFVRCRVGHRDLYAICELCLEFGGLAVRANHVGVSEKGLTFELRSRPVRAVVPTANC